MEFEDQEVYCVVVNHEEQYSIWPAWRQLPEGWREEGKKGNRQECLDHIETVWTDMRPLSLRRIMAEWESQAPAADEPDAEAPAEDLVEMLCSGVHPMRVSQRPHATAEALSRALQEGVVLITFTGTRGETELAVSVDPAQTDLKGGDFAAARGEVRIAGGLTLDGVDVVCRVQVDLATMTGSGGLEAVR